MATNEERFRTPDERNAAFKEWCLNRDCESCELKSHNGFAGCEFYWLALEAEEETEPCFYCGSEMHYRVERRNFTDRHWLECTNSKCGFESAKYESKADAISAHNRVARAVRAAKESEAGK